MKKLTTGVIAQGIVTPIIKEGDDLSNIVISSIEKNGIKLENKDIIAITEAVVAISQGDFVTTKEIQEDVKRKFLNKKEIAIVDPIQSRNRFIEVLKSISAIETLEKVYIFLRYPADEVGNQLVPEELLMEKNINPYSDIMTAEEFYEKVGYPKHPFTGLNYIEEYIKACNGKAEVILCNDFSKVSNYCKNVLVCNIHKKEMVKKIIKKSGAEKVLDLSEIMNEPINGSNYNEQYGLYGTNLMAGDKLKLMPRNSQKFVERLQEKVKKLYNVDVEVMVYGDGAFKDPVGGIWELADPVTTLGATEGLSGTPKEVKLKYLASKYEDKTQEEIEKIVAMEKVKRLKSEETNESSLGTTPRQITDLLASLSDLVTGSGDRQTPVVVIKHYLR